MDPLLAEGALMELVGHVPTAMLGSRHYVVEERLIVQISGLQMELLDTLRLAILAYIVSL